MEIEKGEKWYSDAREYWDTVPRKDAYFKGEFLE